ncbi:MAG: SgcJ/EcaC family oxidoreductase, partial [Actinomycetota bacterium]
DLRGEPRPGRRGEDPRELRLQGFAAAVAAFWSDDATSENEETGERVSGREALQAEFAEFFAASPGARLTAEVDEVRLVRPDVAIAEGSAVLFLPDAEPTESAFTAVLVKDDGRWLIESSHERDLPSPSTPSAALADLEWLIGDWKDDTEGADVAPTVRWSPNRAFLVRKFSV